MSMQIRIRGQMRSHLNAGVAGIDGMQNHPAQPPGVPSLLCNLEQTRNCDIDKLRFNAKNCEGTTAVTPRTPTRPFLRSSGGAGYLTSTAPHFNFKQWV